VRFKTRTYSPGYCIIYPQVVEAPDQVSAIEKSKKNFEQKFPDCKDFTVSIQEMTDEQPKLSKAEG
jgi:hypothetical protein